MSRDALYEVGLQLGQRLYEENEEVRGIVDQMLKDANRQDDPGFRELAMMAIASAQLEAWQADRP